MMGRLFAYVIIFLLVCGWAKGQATPFCADAWHEFNNCLRFVTGLYPLVPTVKCCDSVETLNMMAKSNENGARDICQCIKDMASTDGIPFQASLIEDLFIGCGVHNSFPISNTMDCTKLY